MLKDKQKTIHVRCLVLKEGNENKQQFSNSM